MSELLTEAITISKNLSEIDKIFEQIKNTNNAKQVNLLLDKAEKLYTDEFGLNVKIFFSPKPLHATTISYPILNEIGLKGRFTLIKDVVKGKISKSLYHADEEVVNDVLKRTSDIKLNPFITVKIIIGEQFSGLLRYDKDKKKDLAYDNYGKMTARQLNAVILHEIGHVVFAESQISRNLSNFRKFSLMTFGLGPMFYTMAILNAKFNSIFLKSNPPRVTAFVKGYKGERNDQFELESDSMAIKYGYGKDLHGVIDNILSSNYYQSNKDYLDNHPSAGKELELRKSKIIETLESELSDPNNPLEYRKIIQKQITELKKNKPLAEAYFLKERNPMKYEDDSIFLSEANLYDEIHTISGISKEDCYFLNTPDGMAHVINNNYENILTTIKLEAEVARESKNIATLKEILKNCLEAKAKLNSFISDPRVSTEQRGKVLVFIHELDYIMGRDLKPSLHKTVMSLYTDRQKPMY